MKILFVAVIPFLGFASEKSSPEDSFNAAQIVAAEEFNAAQIVAAEEFGLAAAQRLADVRRRELHGECGMCVFKERIGDAWVFQTKVGYAGSPAPDITVFPPRPASKKKEPISERSDSP